MNKELRIFLTNQKWAKTVADLTIVLILNHKRMQIKMKEELLKILILKNKLMIICLRKAINT